MSWRENLSVGILRARQIFYGEGNGGLGTELDVTELGAIDGVTAGTVSASKAMIVDASKDISGANDFGMDGDLSVGGEIVVGSDDSVQGKLTLYGDSNTAGGAISLYNAGNEDSTQEYWKIEANDSLDFIPEGGSAVLSLDPANSEIVFGIDARASGQLTVTRGDLRIGSTAVKSSAQQLDQKALTVKVDDMSAADTVYIACPFEGKIVGIYGVADGDPGADAIFSVNVNGGTDATNKMTVASGTAAGGRDEASITDHNELHPGYAINVKCDGGASNAVAEFITILVEMYSLD